MWWTLLIIARKSIRNTGCFHRHCSAYECVLTQTNKTSQHKSLSIPFFSHQFPRKVQGRLMRRISLRPSQTSRLSRYSTLKRKQSRHHICLLQSVLVSDIFCLLPPIQIYSSRDLEDNLNKIREICSDDKHDWDQRANAVSRYSSDGIFIWLNIWLFFIFKVFGFFCLFCPAAQEDPLAVGGGGLYLWLLLPAPTTPGWSLQTVG